MNPQTLQQAEEYAAQHGIILSPADRQRINAIQASEHKRLTERANEKQPGWTDWWNDFYPRLLQLILSVGETILTFAQTVIVSLGVPSVLVLLLIVEHQRVVHGIMLFEVDAFLASFAALALVVSNLVLEFTIHHIEHVAGHKDEQGRRWSLKIWAKRALYIMGMGEKRGSGETAVREEWQAEYISPADRYKRLLRLVTFTILSLALVGSMKTVMTNTTGTWYEALISIVLNSSLIEMQTWMSGLLFATAAVLLAQGFSRYVAIRCVEIVATMSARQRSSGLDLIQLEVEQKGAIAAMAIINEKITAKQKKLAAVQRAEEQKSEAVPTQSKLPFGNTALGWELVDPSSVKSDGQLFTQMSAPDGDQPNGKNGNGNGNH